MPGRLWVGLSLPATLSRTKILTFCRVIVWFWCATYVGEEGMLQAQLLLYRHITGCMWAA